MPASQLDSAQHGIIAWSKNADGDTARLVVQAAILVRRSMEPTGRGAANNIGQPIPTVGGPATTTLSEGYWAFAGSLTVDPLHRVLPGDRCPPFVDRIRWNLFSRPLRSRFDRPLDGKQAP
jgi:hypothetical protein